MEYLNWKRGKTNSKCGIDLTTAKCNMFILTRTDLLRSLMKFVLIISLGYKKGKYLSIIFLWTILDWSRVVPQVLFPLSFQIGQVWVPSAFLGGKPLLDDIFTKVIKAYLDLVAAVAAWARGGAERILQDTRDPYRWIYYRNRVCVSVSKDIQKFIS